MQLKRFVSFKDSAESERRIQDDRKINLLDPSSPTDKELLPEKVIDTRNIGEIRCHTQLALTNAEKDGNNRPLPWRVVSIQPGRYCIFDTNEKIFESYGCYSRPELENEVYAQDKSVVADLTKKFAIINEMEESERCAAIEAEYERLKTALYFNNNDYIPTFFSDPELRNIIATLFQQTGRTDLAEDINGIKVGKNLWTKAQQTAPNEDNPHILKINILIEHGYFTAEEIGASDKAIEELLRKTYTHSTNKLLNNIREQRMFEIPLETVMMEAKEVNRRPRFYIWIENLTLLMSKASLSLENSGLQPQEIERIRTTVIAVDSIRHFEENHDQKTCNCLGHSTEYKNIFYNNSTTPRTGLQTTPTIQSIKI